jgi:hypothetical protein
MGIPKASDCSKWEMRAEAKEGVAEHDLFGYIEWEPIGLRADHVLMEKGGQNHVPYEVNPWEASLLANFPFSRPPSEESILGQCSIRNSEPIIM